MLRVYLFLAPSTSLGVFHPCSVSGGWFSSLVSYHIGSFGGLLKKCSKIILISDFGVQSHPSQPLKDVQSCSCQLDLCRLSPFSEFSFGFFHSQFFRIRIFYFFDYLTFCLGRGYHTDCIVIITVSLFLISILALDKCLFDECFLPLVLSDLGFHAALAALLSLLASAFFASATRALMSYSIKMSRVYENKL